MSHNSSIIMTTDNFIPKPNKAMAMHALKMLEVKNSDALMIGNSLYDYKMVKNAKIKTI